MEIGARSARRGATRTGAPGHLVATCNEAINYGRGFGSDLRSKMSAAGRAFAEASEICNGGFVGGLEANNLKSLKAANVNFRDARSICKRGQAIWLFPAGRILRAFQAVDVFRR